MLQCRKRRRPRIKRRNKHATYKTGRREPPVSFAGGTLTLHGKDKHELHLELAYLWRDVTRWRAYVYGHPVGWLDVDAGHGRRGLDHGPGAGHGDRHSAYLAQ